MIQQYRFYHTLFVATLGFLAGCSTTTPFGAHTAGFEGHDPWFLELNPGPGKVEFTVRLHANDHIRLTFAQSDQWSQIAYLELLDDDCEFGHKGHVVYLTEQNGFESAYFTREVPWGNNIHVSLEWVPDSDLLGVRVNDHYQTVPLLYAPSTVRVSGQTDSNTLLELQYQPSRIP